MFNCAREISPGVTRVYCVRLLILLRSFGLVQEANVALATVGTFLMLTLAFVLTLSFLLSGRRLYPVITVSHCDGIKANSKLSRCFFLLSKNPNVSSTPGCCADPSHQS